MNKISDSQQLKHHKAYWKLVNTLTKLCWDSVDEKVIWMDDIISALDRVKTDFVQEQIKFQLQSESEKTPEEDLPDITPKELEDDSETPKGIAGDKLRYIG